MAHYVFAGACVESKHYYFTRLMRVINNYKNACSTLAQRHQMHLAYLLSTGTSFLEHSPQLSSSMQVDMNYLSEPVIEALNRSQITAAKPLHQCQFATINGMQYRCMMYVVIEVGVNDCPVFGRIDAIYEQGMICHMLLRVCSSQYDTQLSAYKINVTDEIKVCSVDSFLDIYPLSGYVVGQHRYIVLKNFVYNYSQFNC